MQASAEQKPGVAAGKTKTLEQAYSFADLSHYPRKKRFLIRIVDLAFFVLIKLIGRTIKFELEGDEHWQAASSNGNVPIYAFWHNRIFLATYYFQRRGIVVMTSRSFDGEYIARFIRRFGYGVARGSSTRGGTGALIEMVRLLRAGRAVAFTIDGPKGPRHVAKMGPVLLAKKCGFPILPVTMTSRKNWRLNSWDQFQVPYPFTAALISFAAPIYVACDADDNVLAAKRDELQQALDELNRRSEEWRGSH